MQLRLIRALHAEVALTLLPGSKLSARAVHKGCSQDTAHGEGNVEKK